jgi:2-methylcitrate dehydratase
MLTAEQFHISPEYRLSMDSIISKLFNFSEKVMAGGIDRTDRDEIKKRIGDSIFVSYGAKDATPVNIIRRALLPSTGRYNASVYFSSEKATVDTAAFINGTMTRYLDYNDTYLSKEALHPSDNIPPILAVSEAMDIKGERAIRAIDVAYEVVGALSDAICIRDLGWDHVTYISISSAAGLASLLQLEEKKFENAVSLGLNNNISMRQTRAGELSMWKGATAADASRNSVFALLLADEGFTGPSPIFTGEMGFFQQVTGGFNLELDNTRVRKTMIKNYPVEYHAMSAAEVSCGLRDRIKGKIQKIFVETFSVAHRIIIKDPEKLRPKTKETADHSMPFIIAYSLLYGDPEPGSYSNSYLSDPKILDLMDKITFTVTDKYNSMYPDYLPFSIHVITDSGEFRSDLNVPRGHFKNPYTWEDLKNKGVKMMGEDSANAVLEVVKDFEKRDARELMEVVSNVSVKR